MKICILGSGAYGIALASVLDENKNDVYVWTKFKEEMNELENTKKCSKLNNISISNSIKITTDLEKAMKGAKIILIATPAKFVRDVIKEVKKYYDNQVICIASKGIEDDSCLFLNEVISEYIKTEDIAVISGPSFAIDVIKKNPVCLTLASKSEKAKKYIFEVFSNNHFKLEYTKDIIGTEICGSVKNIIAIASGILDGLKMPESTTSFLITESISEIKKLIISLGGDESTVLTYAGIGDLILTATSEKSRNYSFGKLIVSNVNKKEINDYIKNTTVEGLYTLNSIIKLTKEKNIDIPLFNIIYDVIYNNKKPQEILNYLTKGTVRN